MYERHSGAFESIVILIWRCMLKKGGRGTRGKLQDEVEKLMKLSHLCVAFPFGFVVSGQVSVSEFSTKMAIS
jgi:hypothetical protein